MSKPKSKPVPVTGEACPLADSLERCAHNVLGAQVPKAALLRLAKEARTQAAELARANQIINELKEQLCEVDPDQEGEDVDTKEVETND